MTPDIALILAIVLPLAGAVLVAACSRRPNLRETVSIVTAVALFTTVASLWAPVMSGARPTVVLAQFVPGLQFALSAEPLGLLFGLVASGLWIVTSIYAIGYMRAHHEHNQTRFYCAFAVALSSAMGVAFADNMFTLFVFYEALTLSTWPLVTHSGTAEARRAGRIYLGLLLGTSIGLQLFAIVWTWQLTGTLDFRPGGVFDPSVGTTTLMALYTLYLFGIGKAALMPLHRWLPAAMVAPTPVSALLHAVAVVKAGVFTVLKVTVYLFGTERLASSGAAEPMLMVAAVTILVASLVAMTRDNLKARLAYSTVSQLGYVVLGAALASSLGVLGGAMQIATHAFGKITLFFCAGAILVAAHKTEVSQLDGLGRRMPLTMGAFAVGALSIIGLPPAGGTWSKWFLVLAALDAGQMAIVATLVASSVLNLMYLLSIPVRGFFRAPPADQPAGVKEAPLACLIAIAVTTAGCLLLFFFPQPLYRLAALAAGL